jgi:DNA primase
MFPIHSLTGRVIGFGGRILTNDKKSPKYQNSPESEIYDKKQTLYGIYFAKNAIARQDECILVEGYFDVLRMHQIGIENVVASSGTSLTMEQIRLVKRYTKNITMLYDGDAAGIHAALRGTDMILSEGMNVRVVVLPPEHDPDTFGKEFSVEYVSNYLKENAKDFIRFKTELLLKDAENDPIKRGQVIRDIVETISVIPDSIFRITYVKECSRLLDMPEQTLTNELNKILRSKLKKTLGIEDNVVSETETTTVPKQEETVEDQLPAGYYQERELVKLLLMYGKNIIVDEREDENGEKVYEQVSVAQLIVDDLKMDGFVFTNVVNKKIFDIFDQAIDAGYIPDDQYFVSHEDETIASLAADLLSSPYKLDQWEKYGIFVKQEEDVLRSTVLSSLYRYKDLIIEERRKAIEEELKNATDIADQLILLKQKKDLDDIRRQINKELGIVIAK